MLLIPSMFVNIKDGVISEAENRVLAVKPKLYNENGGLNGQFFSDFDTWLKDNVGLRNEMVKVEADIQYNLFKNLPDDQYRLSENGELNWFGEQVLENYEHTNLYSDEDLNKILQSFVTVNLYCENKEIQFYYMQCWDKQSIYPEYFPKTINQYGGVSACDQVVNGLQDKTNVNQINLKSKLISEKDNYEVYSKLGDPTHWTPRGAYIGYAQLMDTINEHTNEQYKVLKDEDFNISIADIGQTVSGTIHFENKSEIFSLKEDNSYSTPEKFNEQSDDFRSVYLTNEKCENNKKILILGDSYIHAFILNDISQSFYETILLWKWNISNIKELIEEYHPDIILYEQAEREQDFNPIIAAADSCEK